VKIMREIIDQQLEETLKENKIVIVQFSSKTCAPCHQQTTLLESKLIPVIASKNVKFVKMFIEECQIKSSHYDIKRVPTILVFYKQQLVCFSENDRETDRIIGFRLDIDRVLFDLIQYLLNIEVKN